VKVAALRALALEGLSVVKAVRGELGSEGSGAVAVSGMLAEQLAKELGRDADPGAVVVTEGLGGARVGVRVIAGDPSDEDRALVREAHGAGIPVVLVQLWPQDDWRTPYVLSPFVVECRTGEGFPVAKIASLIALAVEHPTVLAARIPVLRDPVAASIERGSVVRAGLLGFLGAKKGAARPLLVLEQVRMLAQLLALDPPDERPKEGPAAAGLAAASLAASYGFRSLAYAARGRMPRTLAHTVVATAGTWALGEAFRRLEAAGVTRAVAAPRDRG